MTARVAPLLLLVLATFPVASAFAPSKFSTRRWGGAASSLQTASVDPEYYDAYVAGESKELAIKDSVVGTGEEANTGQLLTVSFKGRTMTTGVTQNVKKFSFKLGDEENVMKGWQEGLPGMKVGGTRLLRIPSGDLTKGGKGEDLEFEIELLGVTEGAFNEFLVMNGLGANAKTYGIFALVIFSALLPQLQKAGIIT